MTRSEDDFRLLRALDDIEWRTVNYRLGNFHPSEADALVRAGLAERRERDRKPGAYLYRRTVAARAVLGETPENGGAPVMRLKKR